VFDNQASDAQAGTDHIEQDKFRIPERLFETEKPIFSFKANFPGRGMDMRAPVLFHEFAGFAIPGKMDCVSLLLQVMPEMETPGCVPESFTTNNKENFH
jgi:hypothetical protein